ncbi:extracellular solute-binding protein [Clostridium sp. Marseille-Q2269]|uniref:ABC transporter substrate-binding protein n=1 Tax=Clostridium sp. Marseille-Q2269 TaxID=2942205 RepID=UPI0020749BAE|nr:extracellular solute-binding protein [Clostridium sp. Marseille-Q2269]
MKNKPIKICIYVFFIVLLISGSVIYGKKLNNQIYMAQHLKNNNEKDKTIIKMWVKQNELLETRKYQVNRFNSENKDNIRVVISSYDKDYYNMIRTSLVNNNGPDIFEYSGDRELFENNNLANLQDLNIDTNKINQNYLFKYEGIPYGVNIMGNNVKLIWNKELFKKAGLDPDRPPKTWKELIEFSEKIKEKDKDITPLKISLNRSAYEDLRVYIGSPSVSGKDIYTTFWNPKEGKYNFQDAKEILKIYNYMYKNKLINYDFESTTRNSIRLDFYSNKVGMMLSTFDDKNYFSNIIPLNFEIGISNLPKVNLHDKENYYYVNNSECFFVNNDVLKNKNKSYAVKQFYQWIISEDINKEILKTRKALPIILENKNLEKDIYKEYNNNANFKNQQYDPTEFINHSFGSDYKILSDVIKGTRSIESGIKELNKIYDLNCKVITEKNILDLNNFIEK